MQIKTTKIPICLILIPTLILIGFSPKTVRAEPDDRDSKIGSDICPPSFPDEIHCIRDVPPEVAVSQDFLTETQTDIRRLNKRPKECPDCKPIGAAKWVGVGIISGFFVGVITGVLVGSADGAYSP